LPMLFTIEALYVIEEEVGIWKNLFKSLVGDVPCGIHGGMYSIFFAGFQNFGKKINLEHTFAARKGHTAARVFIENLVFQYFSHDFIDGIFLSADLPCIMRTIKRTFAAKLAFFKCVRTLFSAFSATRALVFIKHHLRLLGLTFGIVAPSTTKITALEKHGRADAGAVNKGVSFDVK